MTMEEFLDTAKLDIKGIPGRGDPAVVTDLLGGSIDVAALVQGTLAGQNLRAGTPLEIVAKLEAACAGAAKDEVYANAAKRGGQPPNYYAGRATFGARLDRDIEAKRRLIARMKLQM